MFGPMIAAAGHLEAGTLELMEVIGWDVQEPLFFACNGDRVLARDQRALIDAMRGALESAQRI